MAAVGYPSVGTALQSIRVNAAGNGFEYFSPGSGGSGDVTAASTFGTDNVLIRADGTSKGVQSTGIVVDDTTNAMHPSTNDAGVLGTSSLSWSDLFLASGAVINFNAGNVTLTHSAGVLTLGGSGAATLALGTNSITMTGSLGATGARLTAGFFTDLTVTNAIAGSVTGNAATVTGATFTTALTVNGGTLTLTANVANSSVLTIGAGAVSVSGTNTGDQTSVSGNAGTATALQNARTIGGVSFNGTADITVATATGGFTVSGGALAIGANNLTMTGSLAATGARVTKGWFTDIESTNMPTVGGTAILTSLTAPQFTTIELGHASDTTLSRVSAGVVAIEGVNILTVAGGTLTGAITLGENTAIALDPAGSADGKYTGITVTGTAGYAQTFGDLVYLDPTDSRWEKCDANSAAGADGDSRGIIGIVVVAGAADGNACTILLQGIIRADAAFPTFTVNNPIYVSETAGAVTQTQPTTTDVVIRVVGIAITADEMYFDPSKDYITHT